MHWYVRRKLKCKYQFYISFDAPKRLVLKKKIYINVITVYVYVEVSKCLLTNKHVLLGKPEYKSKYKVQGRISLLLPFMRMCRSVKTCNFHKFST